MSEVQKALFETMSGEVGTQKRIPLNSAVSVYYGISSEGNLRLSFMSSIAPPKMDSTKLLRVVQGKENDTVFWTGFELLELSARQVFYSFCCDLVDAVEGIFEARKGLVSLKNRFHVWRTMFKKTNMEISSEKMQGLFGELYFIDRYLADKWGMDEAISAWSGADGTAKDFSIGIDWYEIKAVSTSSASVKISSVSQLSSNVPGFLVIIRLETMSPIYTDGQSSIGDLFQSVLMKIDLNETRDKFLNKLISYGVSMSDDCCMERYCVASMKLYRVDGSFPRLIEDDIKYKEICKVSYDLIINSLDRYREDK